MEDKNPIGKVAEQCDPYSSFGVFCNFCNANGLIEGFLIIIGVVLLVAGTIWFVKKNQEENKEKHKERYAKYYNK